MRNSNLKQILWIAMAWVILAILEFGHTFGALASAGCPMPAGQARIMFVTAVLSGSLAGVLGGTLIVLVFRKWLRQLSYGVALLRILVSFSITFFGISILTGFYFHTSEMQLPPGHPQVIREVFSIFFELDSIRTYLFWLLVVLGTTIGQLVNEKYGPGVFRDFLLGRYFRPRREERIFMFLDLRGSTTLAEQLGEARYFLLIQDLFRELTSPILAYKGQIYQYIGDEVVVSWDLRTGLAEGRCIQCFLDIQRMLLARAPYYQEEFGLQPEFKAGLHYGYVMAGEVGVVKREIAFSGDVLNTTARIQSKCNDLGVNVLFSEKLFHALPAALQSTARALGSLSLRGKEAPVAVYTV